MKGLVGYRVILNLVQKGGKFLTVNIEVNDVAIGGVGKVLELFLIYCERDVLNTVAINNARDFAGSANLAHVSFTSNGPLGTGDSQMFHLCLI